MPSVQTDGALLVVPAGCLDGDIAIVPDGHIFMSGKANWDDHLETLPKYDAIPDFRD